jgi:hypothetical protein
MTLYRTVFSVEVLSDYEVAGQDIEEIAYQIKDGDCSGKLISVVQEELTKQEMAEALRGQGSDPAFLLGEDDDGL